jgi:hypothetical protein
MAIKSANAHDHNAAIILICRDYLPNTKDKIQASAEGSNRLLFRLCPKRYEFVRITLDLAKEIGYSDESAMLNISYAHLKVLNQML